VETNDSEGEDPDARVLEKIFLIEQCLELFDGVFAEFLAVRLSSKWAEEAEAVRVWINKG